MDFLTVRVFAGGMSRLTIWTTAVACLAALLVFVDAQWIASGALAGFAIFVWASSGVAMIVAVVFDVRRRLNRSLIAPVVFVLVSIFALLITVASLLSQACCWVD
jgi:hypothetical protein